MKLKHFVESITEKMVLSFLIGAIVGGVTMAFIGTYDARLHPINTKGSRASHGTYEDCVNKANKLSFDYNATCGHLK